MAEEKKGMFGGAKAKPTTAKAKDDKETVLIAGLSEKLLDLQKLKGDIADLESILTVLTDEVKNISKDQYVDLYIKNKTNPNTFLIKDDEGCVMVLPTDKYNEKQLTEERIAELRKKYGKDIVQTTEKFYFDPVILERNLEKVESLLMNSPDISDADKDGLILKEVKNTIRKGAIDDLLKYDPNVRDVLDDIQPVFQLKNCGGKSMGMGGQFDDEYFDDEISGYSNCCNAPVYGETDICTECGEHCMVEHEEHEHNHGK
jgi:hypothetical protein